MSSSNKRRQFLKAAGLVTAGTFAGCLGDSGETEEATLRAASILPKSDPTYEIQLTPWMEKVTEKTGGAITFEEHPAGALAGGGEHLRILREQTADVAMIGPAYSYQTIPLTTVAILPGLFNDLAVGTFTQWELMNGILWEEELESTGIKCISCQIMPFYQIHTTGAKVKSLEDWEGLDVRTNGGTNGQAVEALGATSTVMTVEEMLTALEQGVVDAFHGAAYTVEQFGMTDVIETFTLNAGVGTSAPFHAINLDTWESLSEDIQDAMNEASEEVVQAGPAKMRQARDDGRDALREAGIDTYRAPREEVRKWHDMMDPVVQGWVEENDGGQEVLDTWKETAQQFQ
jgi:TRAP-type C4-dicarboxylate transport system substrate-binding protein